MPKALSCSDFKDMLLSGTQYLLANRSKIDDLNVFPIPDGDTGTNMALTMQTGMQKVMEYNGNKLSEFCKLLSSAMIGAGKGNSGTILSQIVRGICQVAAEYNSIDIKVFVKGLENATTLAYKNIKDPKEGTILTVIKRMSTFASTDYKNHKSYIPFMQAVLQEGEKALCETPEYLPVLKEANVVDAGGMGLIILWKGFLASLQGEKLDTNLLSSTLQQNLQYSDNYDIISLECGEIEYGYCTEFLIQHISKKGNIDTIIDKLTAKLSQIGDSLICLGDETVIKVHVHTANPAQALAYGLEIGELNQIKIDNMIEQNRAFRANLERTRKDMGILSISSGSGFANIFKNDLLVDAVLEGGQSANPSTGDIANAIKKINAKNIFILPNNKNIILASEQVKMLVENKNIYVIPTTTIPEGIVAALQFDPESTVEKNFAAMQAAFQSVVCGQVTTAIRNTTIDGIAVEIGDFIGVDSKKVLAKSKTKEDAVRKLLAKLKKDCHEMITLYYGEGVTEEEAQALQLELTKEYPNCEVNCLEGGQAVYNYILCLE